MRANHRAIESYGQVKVSTGASQANNVELIQMLFDGLKVCQPPRVIFNTTMSAKNQKPLPAPAALCWVCKVPWTLKRVAIWLPT